MPRFPFPRSVATDLRDQYKADRLEAQTNHLGYTSLGPDDGSAEVRDANDNVLAHFGHAAGKAGFLVPNGSGWQTIQEHVAASTAALGARVTTAEGRLDAHASRLGAAENDISAASARLDAHGNRLNFAESDIDSLEATKVGFSTHNALAGRVGAVENDVAGIKTNGNLQTPNLTSPKIIGITAGAQDSTWVPLLVNKSTGALRSYGSGPIG